jgi:hypothetical protein
MEFFTSHSAKTFRNIQGLTTLISKHAAELDQLVSNLTEEACAIGPLTEDAVVALEPSDYVIGGWYAVSLESVREYVLGLASWTDAIVANDDKDEVHEMLKDVGIAFVVACYRIDAIIDERNPEIDGIVAPSSLPPALPHELVRITAADFLRKARKQTCRLERQYSRQQIDAIADQHKALLRAYRNEPVIREVIAGCNEKTSFEAAWGLLSSLLSNLCEFCGGIATFPPSTSTVESDFSVLRWEKDNFRRSQSDFGLEGVLQTKLYCQLEDLVASV